MTDHPSPLPAPDSPEAHHARRPDLGTPTTSVLALVAAVVITSVTIIMQLFFSAPPPLELKPGEVAPPDAAMEMVGKLTVKLRHVMPGMPTQGLGSVAVYAETDADRVRAAIADGEIHGAGEALKQLDALTAPRVAEEPVEDDVLQDIALVRRIYTDGSSASLTPEERERLIDRHEWFGRLAVSFGAPATDPDRQELIAGGMSLMLVLLAFGGIIVVAGISGLVLFIVALTAIASGKLRWRFVPPTPGGSVYLEAFAFFVGSFLVFKLVMSVVELAVGATAEWLGLVSLIGQWALMVTLAYPALRGVARRDRSMQTGWHRGEGVLKEIGCGIVGYLAGLPVFAAGILVTLMLQVIVATFQQLMGKGEGGSPAPNSSVQEILASASPIMLVILYLLATVWAPIVEETVFRGWLFRHVRSRVGVVIAALVTGTVFSAMHSYGVMFLPPLIALGAVFAVMREWRGSIIAPMTAHALHNGVVMLVLMAIMRILG